LRKKTKTSCFFYPTILFIIFLLGILSSSDTVLAFEQYTHTSQAEISGKGVEEFHLIAPANLGGKINLQVGDDDICHVEFECWAKAKNRKMAKEFTELVEIYLEKEVEVVTLKLITPRGAPWEGTNYGIKATLDIYIPPDIIVDTRTRHFHLDVSGPLKKVFIENDYGEILLSDVSEETNVSGTYNKVEVESVEGKVDIETSFNSIRLRDVDTKGNRAFLRTTHGKIEVERFTGQLEATTLYSPIHASDISLTDGENEIKTVHSKIDLELEDIKDCELYVNNSFGNINVAASRDLSARLTLTVGHGGKIETNGILIKPLVLEKTRLEGICGDGDSEIELDIKGIGKILVEGR